MNKDRLMKLIIFPVFLFYLYSCAIPGIYVHHQRTLNDILILCENKFFIRYANDSFLGTDTITGKWENDKNIITLKYNSEIYKYKDTLIKCFEQHIDTTDSLKILIIDSQWDSYDIYINDTIKLELINSKSISLYRPNIEIKKIKFIKLFNYSYNEFYPKNKNSNYFIIKVNSNRSLPDSYLRLNPPTKFKFKLNKLIPLDSDYVDYIFIKKRKKKQAYFMCDTLKKLN